VTTTASRRHPDGLEALDRRYIVPWGYRESARVLGGATACAAILAILAALHSRVWLVGLVPVAALAAFLVLFFRNPRRTIPEGAGIVVSPADGAVSDICEVDEQEFLHCRAVRIGIFLSIFSVHVNRAPVAGRVEWLSHRDGAHFDARRPECATQNESNWIGIVREEGNGRDSVTFLVKQVSGAIARRIICPLEKGSQVRRGGLIGMIKYGSRTELYIPLAASPAIRVAVGQKVQGGATVVAEVAA